MTAAVSADRMATPGTVTDYFEIDSDAAGARFAVAVSLPRGYEHAVTSAPLVYTTDGNLVAPLTDAVRIGLVDHEARASVEPFIQVSIGYTAADAPSMLILRNRDLVPPDEPVPAVMIEHIRGKLGRAEELVDAFFAQQRDGRADAFLTFLTEELHPQIADRYRFRSGDVGLFGYSYGGLFTLYALLSGSGPFTRFGASSPGVLTPGSRIHEMYARLVQDTTAGARTDARARHLHLTVNEHELLGTSSFYRCLGIEVLRFLDATTATPLPGLTVTPEVIAGESHATGLVDALRSFLRTCYPGGRP